jgi:hypothetical protein
MIVDDAVLATLNALVRHALLSVVAAFSVAGAVIAAVSVVGGAALGIWLAKRLARLGNGPGEPEASFRENLRRKRAHTRKLLSPGERRFIYAYTLVGVVLPPLAIGLLVFGRGSTRGVGIGLLLLALVVMAVPVSPVLRARARRRERRDGDSE